MQGWNSTGERRLALGEKAAMRCDARVWRLDVDLAYRTVSVGTQACQRLVDLLLIREERSKETRRRDETRRDEDGRKGTLRVGRGKRG